MEIKLLLVLCYFNPRTPRGVRLAADAPTPPHPCISIHAPREGCDTAIAASYTPLDLFQSTHPARGATCAEHCDRHPCGISIHAPREGCDRGHLRAGRLKLFQSTHPARGATSGTGRNRPHRPNFNPRTPRGVRQQTLPKSREFAWLNLLICTRGRRLSIQKQTRLCSIKLSFMLFGCEPAGEGVSSWTSHATKSKVRLEGRSA